MSKKHVLKIFEQINHFNGSRWFVVQELTSGEELAEFDTLEEAQKELKKLIDSGRYSI